MASIRADSSGRFLIEGDLDFTNILALRQQAETLLAGGNGEAVFDLSSVGRVDTAALSLLLCLRRKAAELGTEVRFHAVPEDLRSIARLSDLGPVLGPL